MSTGKLQHKAGSRNSLLYKKVSVEPRLLPCSSTLFQLESSSPWLCSPSRSLIPSPITQRCRSEPGEAVPGISQRWAEGWVLLASQRRIAHIPANLSPAAPEGQQAASSSSQASEEALTPSLLWPKSFSRVQRQWERGIHSKIKHLNAAPLPP